MMIFIFIRMRKIFGKIIGRAFKELPTRLQVEFFSIFSGRNLGKFWKLGPWKHSLWYPTSCRSRRAAAGTTTRSTSPSPTSCSSAGRSARTPLPGSSTRLRRSVPSFVNCPPRHRLRFANFGKIYRNDCQQVGNTWPVFGCTRSDFCKQILLQYRWRLWWLLYATIILVTNENIKDAPRFQESEIVRKREQREVFRQRAANIK